MAVDNRRREPRQSTNLRGAARYGVSGHEKPCTVSDLTSLGAGLSFSSTFGIPSRFQLLINGETHPRFCRVIWSDPKRLGVQFE
jgi:hypothetical protein